MACTVKPVISGLLGQTGYEKGSIYCTKHINVAKHMSTSKETWHIHDRWETLIKHVHISLPSFSLFRFPVTGPDIGSSIYITVPDKTLNMYSDSHSFTKPFKVYQKMLETKNNVLRYRSISINKCQLVASTMVFR